MVITGDNPIRNLSEDLLSRSGGATRFAEQTLMFDLTQGLVVGVLGPWGSGKTSFLNLARPAMEKSGAVMLDFNPWMFSGADQLVDSFFSELSAQLRVKPELADVGKSISQYGQAFSKWEWLPFIGSWVEKGKGASQLVGEIMQLRDEGVEGRRKKLQAALLQAGIPIVVILDDIDRLSTQEIRDVFKLVRLTASFPNIIYVLSFDRARVESALGEEHIPGRDYLEKILQLVIDLPAIPAESLRSQTLNALSSSMGDLNWIDDEDQQRWSDVYEEIISPLIENMRDVRRYAASVAGTAQVLGGQLAVSDLMAMEALRTFLPDVFSRMQKSVAALTTTFIFWRNRGVGGESPELKQAIDEMIRAAGDDNAIVMAMIKRLFPAAERHVGGATYEDSFKPKWLMSRRVAHESNLRLYLERVAGESLLAFNHAQEAWAVMEDVDAFTKFLDATPTEQLVGVLEGLQAHNDFFEERHVLPGVVGSVKQIPRVSDHEAGLFFFGDSVVRQLCYQLLSTIDDEEKCAVLVGSILNKINTLNGKWQIIKMVGHREGSGQKLVPPDVAVDMERAWRSEVRTASAGQLADEHGLLHLVLMAQSVNHEGEIWIPPADARVTLSLLRSARTQSRRQTVGNRSVQYTDRLAWDALVKVMDLEYVLKLRIDTAREWFEHEAPDLFALTDKYLSGWRPPQF